MKRTDTHRPSAINPREYEWVGIDMIQINGLGDAHFLMAERQRIHAHMKSTGGTYSHHEHGGVCAVCGNANAITTHLFHHAPSNSYVSMGQDCAMKCEIGMDMNRVNAFRRNLDDARKNAAGKAKAQLVLDDHNLGAAWSIYTAEDRQGWKFEEVTISDIVGKLVKYGSVSDKQIAFVAKLLAKIEDRPRAAAERAAEAANAAPAPSGRVEVDGEILTVKVIEDPQGIFPDRIKMLVRAVAGWKLWVTVPSSLDIDNLRGKNVKLRATVTPSKDDPKFAFGSRPFLIAVN